MHISDFDYDLPPDLVARYPLAERTASRLLCLDRGVGTVTHRNFTDLPDLLRRGDLLVFNDTRVIPARLRGRKESGGRIEVLIERVTGPRRALAQVRASKSPGAGVALCLGESGRRARVIGREGEFFDLEFEDTLDSVLETEGEMPLPPYIERAAEEIDAERYQTVYAGRSGAVAAPTAGLHFDTDLLAELARRGVDSARVTLHVGAGTFQPVRAEQVEEHRMHAEYMEVGAETCEAVATARARGGRVIAVGTTSVRALETAAAGGSPEPFRGDTRAFIYPGYRFRCVDGLITNFHLPRSTLLMLVCAFAGRGHVLDAYAAAVRERYRFFSYGDAMFIAAEGESA